jgi:hypothetical protein
MKVSSALREETVTDTINKHDDKLDIPVWGARDIAAVIQRDERATAHLLRNGKLPAKKVGHQFVSTRRKLLRAMGVL